MTLFAAILMHASFELPLEAALRFQVCRRTHRRSGTDYIPCSARSALTAAEVRLSTPILPNEIFDFDIMPGSDGPIKHLDGSIDIPLAPDLW
jgi:hypothetical protein